MMKEVGLVVTVPERRARRKKKYGKIEVTRSNEHFQVDMTKVWCGRDGCGYLFAVIDAFDRELIGYKLSRWCRTDELMEAVEMALQRRFPPGAERPGVNDSV